MRKSNKLYACGLCCTQICPNFVILVSAVCSYMMAYLIIILLILHAVSIEPLTHLILDSAARTTPAPSFSNTTVLATACIADTENKKYLYIIGILVEDMCPGDNKYMDYLFSHWMCLVFCSLQLRIFSNRKWSSKVMRASTIKTAYNREYPDAPAEVGFHGRFATLLLCISHNLRPTPFIGRFAP